MFDVQALGIIAGPSGKSLFSAAQALHHYHGVQITVSILLKQDLAFFLSSLYHSR